MVTWVGAAVAVFAIALAGSALLTLRLVRKAEADYPPVGASIEVEGVRLHYLERGQGRHVILIHGLRGSAYDFEVSISEGLARDHHVIAFDRPGNGYSDPLPDDRQSVFVEARQLHAAALKLGLLRPLIVGYSLGAAVAIAYADAYPEDVAGVVTIAGHVMPCRVHVGALAFFAKRPLIAGVTSNTLLVPVGRLVGRMLLRRACSPQPMPASYAKAALAMALRPRTFRYAPEELRRSADELRVLARRYGRLPVHVTVIAGRGDAVSSVNEARYFHERLARSTLVMVPDGGHALHATHPDVVVAAVRGASDHAATGHRGNESYGTRRRFAASRAGSLFEAPSSSHDEEDLASTARGFLGKAAG
jgi:pimeloyl-ACP methyl ester carboxylesterase